MPLDTDDEFPWLPAEADESFDPLDHHDVEIDKETPMVVTPRGGAREVGRSCYQVDTEYGRYLVDCGLNQGGGGQFPDFRGLEPNSVDAVFLTHAHIDHCGGLPVLENRGYLKDDAPIITTPPTTQIAQTLLEDSLKIHKRESRLPSNEQQFNEQDVQDVYERFTPMEYGEGRVEEYAPVPDYEPLTFELGNAAHLLGSAWVALQVNGYRTLFSGDIGGRATHLPDISPPPKADHLVIESTYGSKHSHTSMSDARTEVYNAIERALKSREPVVIPTFAVGRAQTLLLLLTERLHTLPNNLDEDITLVLDGMAQEATQLYHTHTSDESYFDESIVNRVENGTDTLFLPEGTELPESDEDRNRILEEFNPETGENIPVVIAPSGMLTGGHSPRYITEFAARYDDANIILTGYQAVGTGGRALQAATESGADEVTVEFDTDPFDMDWPESDDVVWSTDEDGERVVRARIPTDWVKLVDGLSGHASQYTLLEFARDVSPETISLVHGPDHSQEALAQHFATNIESVDQVARSRMLTPIEVTRDPDLETASLSEDMFEPNRNDTYKEQFENLYELVSVLTDDVASVRNDAITNEDVIRDILREELETILQEQGNDGGLPVSESESEE